MIRFFMLLLWVVFIPLKAAAQSYLSPIPRLLLPVTINNGDVSSQVALGSLSNVSSSRLQSDYQLIYGAFTLPLVGLAVAVPHREGVFNLGYQYFGDRYLGQQQIGLAYTHRLGAFTFGLRLNQHGSLAEQRAPQHIYSLDLGLGYTINQQWMAVLDVQHIGSEWGKSNEAQAMRKRYRIGLRYAVSSSLFAHFEVDKSLGHHTSGRFALQYVFPSQWYLIGQSQFYPFAQTFGFGGRFQQFSGQYLGGLQYPLGFSHALSLAYTFSK